MVDETAVLMSPGAVAQRAPDRAAVVMTGSGDVVTYRELEERSCRLARLLRARGLDPGDQVAILLENHPRYLEVMWAAVRAGLYYTPVNWHLTPEEVAYIVNDCGATAIVSSSRLASLAAALDEAVVPWVTTRLAIGGGVAGWDDYESAVAAFPAEPLADEREGLPMYYSSGTTGRPKGIKRPLGSEPLGTRADPVSTMLALLGVQDGDVYLSPAPMYHAAPAGFGIAATRVGATVAMMESFDAGACLEAIGRHRVTHAQFVPTHFVRMLKLPEDVRAAADVSSLRGVIHAAAPCPVETKREMIEWWGPIILEYYASSEGVGATFISSQEWLDRPGSAGRAVVGTPRVLDDDGNELPAGEVGTIWFAGAAPFEYHNDPAKTAEAVNVRGEATTGDVGYVDADGYLYLTDRRSYLVISGGVNISPQEAENVLTVHPKVFDVAVFGVPNAEMGEEVKAVVQPVEWSEAGPELEAELIAYCKAHLASFKCPRSVDFERELPRLDNGKLYKRELRDRYWAGGAGAAASVTSS